MPSLPQPASSLPSPKPRWWPALVLVSLAALALVLTWLGEADDNQTRVLRTVAVLLLASLLLLLWLLFFSRLPRHLRTRLFAGLLAVGLLGGLLFEVRGVSGDFVPILGWRFGGGHRLGEGAAGGGHDADQVSPEDFAQFLGPHRNATLPGPRLGRDWLADPPRERWRRPVGEGWSGFAVAGEAAVTQEQRGDLEAVARYDLGTGEQVWAHTNPGRYETTVAGIGPRATPTIAGRRVYALGATGVLSALDLETGELLWSVQVLDDNGASLPEWGKSCSPLVIGERVVVSAGGPAGRSLVAYDRVTGKRAWAGGDDGSGYSSPALMTLAGVTQVVIFNRASVAGHDPETGALLWSQPWSAQQPNVAQPVAVGSDRLLVSSGYGVGSSLLHLTRDPAGGFTVEPVWQSPRLKAKFANFVVRAGVVYGLDDGTLTAIDLATGERRWKRGRYGHGQLLLVGELLLLQSENGDVALVEANPDEHRELGSFTALDGKTWNSPALAGRYLLVRNDREAVCYELPLES